MDFWINLGWSFKIPTSNRPPSRYITVYANFNTRDVSNLPVSITLIKNEEREKEFSSNKLYIYEVILRLKFHGLFNKERKKKKRKFLLLPLIRIRRIKLVKVSGYWRAIVHTYIYKYICYNKIEIYFFSIIFLKFSSFHFTPYTFYTPPLITYNVYNVSN